MQGWRTVALGLVIAIGTPAVQYLTGVNWVTVVGPIWAPIITSGLMIGMRLLTTTPVGQKS